MPSPSPFLSLCFLALLPLLTACYDYSDELITEQQLAQARVDGEVQLAMTLSENTATRMTATETQASDGSFLGITQIYAIPFGPASGTIAGSDQTLYHPYGLGGISSSDNNTQNVFTATTPYTKSKLYAPFPKVVGTTAYLVYAFGGGDSQAHGKVSGLSADDMAAVTTASSLQPSPVSFVSGGTDAQKAKGQALADYLTTIANATGWAASSDADYAAARTDFLRLHAASSLDVKATVQGLYTLLSNKTDAVATAIKAAITGTGNANATVSGTGFQTVVTLSQSLSNYPSEMGLPDGAAAIAWDAAENKFVTNSSENTGIVETSGNTLLVTPLDHFVYPLPLIYCVSSPVVTSNADETDHWADDTAWSAITSNYTDGGMVLSTTQSVAVKDQLNYAVARLETQVRASAGQLADYRETSISLTNGSDPSFPITGLLVGGQKKVNFEFHPDDSDADYYVVYDATMPSSDYSLTTNAMDTQPTIHTLLFESEKASTTKLRVPVAVELQNNSGQDFYGVNGDMVPKGAKFYLAGIIDMTDNSGLRALEQDHVTTIKCTIGTLKSAYNVVPDLRDTRLNIGLTVQPWIVSTPSNAELF